MRFGNQPPNPKYADMSYPEIFHKVVEVALFSFRRCQETKSSRGCAYDSQSFNENRVSVMRVALPAKYYLY